MTFTIDDTTQASMPGQIEISQSKYLDYLRLKGFDRQKYSLLLSLPKWVLHKLVYSNSAIFQFVRTIEHFKYGCLNPSIVINKEKGIIATFTDLAAFGNFTTPVIKISEEPLDLITNLEISNGSKLPTVALYTRNQENELATAWADFNPKIANCFTDDLAVCNKLLSRISDKDWRSLEIGLSQISNKERLGLYYISF